MRLQATCPRCLERPSRRVLVNTSGKPALCLQCKSVGIYARCQEKHVPGRRAASAASPETVERLYQAVQARMLRRR